MSDLAQSAILGVSIGAISMLAFNLYYSIKNSNSAKSKREKSRKVLEEEISKLKSQRSFLARKFKDLSDENDQLKLVNLKKTREVVDLKEEKEKLEKENKQLKETNENLFSKMKGFIRTNTAYNA